METQSLTIENVPRELAEQIRLQADQHGRSVSDEALDVLKKHVPASRRLEFPDNLIPTLKPITTEMVLEGIREGRK